MENNSRRLSFPQRNWLLLCIIVAILSPLVTSWLTAEAHRKNYHDAIEQRPANGNDAGTGQRNVKAGATNVGNDTGTSILTPQQPGAGGAKPGSGGK